MFYKELWVGLLAQCADWNQVSTTSSKFSENFIVIKNYHSGLKQKQKTAIDLGLHQSLNCQSSADRKRT